MLDKKVPRMTSNQRREVVQRYQAGERAVDIAWGMGYSSASIYRILRNYRKRGDAAFEVQGSGGVRDPARRLNKKHIDWLKTVLPNESPQSMGIDECYDKAGRWTPAEIKKLLVKELGVAPSHDECRRAAELVGVRTGIHLPSRFNDWKEQISGHYVAWRKRQDAKKLSSREKQKIGSTTPPLGGASFRGRIPFDDVEWRECSYHYQLDDPVLTAEQGEAASRHLMTLRPHGKLPQSSSPHRAGTRPSIRKRRAQQFTKAGIYTALCSNRTAAGIAPMNFDDREMARVLLFDEADKQDLDILAWSLFPTGYRFIVHGRVVPGDQLTNHGRQDYSIGRLVKHWHQRLGHWRNFRDSEAKGTLWQERFRCSVLNDSQDILAAGISVDAMPMWQGLTNEPGEYFFSSVHAADLGDSAARNALAGIVGMPKSKWPTVRKHYAKLLAEARNAVV